jgi:hypothetical protein
MRCRDASSDAFHRRDLGPIPGRTALPKAFSKDAPCGLHIIAHHRCIKRSCLASPPPRLATQIAADGNLRPPRARCRARVELPFEARAACRGRQPLCHVGRRAFRVASRPAATSESRQARCPTPTRDAGIPPVCDGVVARAASHGTRPLGVAMIRASGAKSRGRRPSLKPPQASLAWVRVADDQRCPSSARPAGHMGQHRRRSLPSHTAPRPLFWETANPLTAPELLPARPSIGVVEARCFFFLFFCFFLSHALSSCLARVHSKHAARIINFCMFQPRQSYCGDQFVPSCIVMGAGSPSDLPRVVSPGDLFPRWRQRRPRRALLAFPR